MTRIHFNVFSMTRRATPSSLSPVFLSRTRRNHFSAGPGASYLMSMKYDTAFMARSIIPVIDTSRPLINRWPRAVGKMNVSRALFLSHALSCSFSCSFALFPSRSGLILTVTLVAHSGRTRHLAHERPISRLNQIVSITFITRPTSFNFRPRLYLLPRSPRPRRPDLRSAVSSLSPDRSQYRN